MKRLITVIGLVLFVACHGFASEHSALARVTVYWNSKRSGANAAWNGARLREGHCAVDPKKIAYGSKVVFEDAECVAVDRTWLIAKPRGRAAATQLNATLSSSIAFSILNKRRSPGQKRIHIL